MRKSYLSLCALLLLSGCVSISSTLMDPSFVPAGRVVPSQVKILLAQLGDLPGDDCTRVAILHAKGTRFTDEGELYDKLREETGILGGNTVFIMAMEDPSTGERIAELLGGRQADRDSDAIALLCSTQE
ncbi:MAG: hypothetical protein VYD78_08435 [Gemmatimonadota bacterium]|nr:hypothetical protein [Gemmatimonadota bacterium]